MVKKTKDMPVELIIENCEKIVLSTIIKDEDCGDFLKKLLSKHKFSKMSYLKLFKLVIDLLDAHQPLKGLSKLIEILLPTSDISDLQKEIQTLEDLKPHDFEYQFALGFLCMLNRK